MCSCAAPFPQIDIIGAVVIVWRVRGKNIRYVLCNTVCSSCAHDTAVHTHMNRPNTCLLVRFSFFVAILYYSLSVLDLALWDYFVCYLCMCAFVVLVRFSFFSTMLSVL